MAGYFGKGKSVALIDGLTPANNLSDVESAATSIINLGITATATELNYSDGVTSNVQTQLDTKATTGKAIAMSMIFGG